MKRQLLLLNNPGIPNINYRPSVLSVQKRYKNYFMSPIGGYWDETEILEMPGGLNNIEQQGWLSQAIMNLNSGLYSYSIIVFTGHGASLVHEGYAYDCIQLSAGALFPVSEICFGKGVRRTVIIDACRNRTNLNESQLKQQEILFDNLASDLKGLFCRDYYNKQVMTSNPHVELLQSTELGSKAYATMTGSVFSDALFTTIADCNTMWKAMAKGMDDGELRFDLERLMEMSKEKMVSAKQIPMFSSTSEDRFPFYVVKRG